MKKFKTMKDSMLKVMFNKWKFVSQLKDDGSKYGSALMEDWVKNDILGICKVKEIKELETSGAITYQYGNWVIRTESMIVDKSNKDRFHSNRSLSEEVRVPAFAWVDYMKKKKTNKVY